MVNSADLEACVRGACGTWTRSEFKRYLRSTELSSAERRTELRKFVASEKQLRRLCASECYSCSADVLACLKTSHVRTHVDAHNAALRGGKGSQTRTIASSTDRDSRRIKGSMMAQKNVRTPRSNRNPKIRKIQDCPNWDSEKKCVTDEDTCLDELDVIGYGHAGSNLSTEQCYSQTKLRKWVEENPEERKTTFTDQDLDIIKGPMKDDETLVVHSLTSAMVRRYSAEIEKWQHNTKMMAMTSSNEKGTLMSKIKKQTLKTGLVTAAGYASLALLNPAFAMYGAGMGALASFDWIRQNVMSKGIDLVVWIVKSPKTAMMFLFIAKQFIKAACKEAAIIFSRAQYERKDKLSQYASYASGVLGVFTEAGEISMGSLMRAATSGETWKALWNSCGDLCISAVASVIPGGALVQSGAGMIVRACVNCAEEAARTGVELAAYQKDIKTGMRYVGDILKLVLNPDKCMRENGLISYATCDELTYDENGCRKAEECKYTPQDGTIPPKCEEMTCEDFTEEKRCKSDSKCDWEADKCQRKQSSWTSNIIPSVPSFLRGKGIAQEEKRQATGRPSEELRARHRHNAYVQLQHREIQ